MYTIHDSSLFWLKTGTYIQIIPPNTCTLYTVKPEEWAAVYSIHVLGGINLYVPACFKPEEWAAVYSVHVLGGMICMYVPVSSKKSELPCIVPPNTCTLYTAAHSSDLKQADTYKSYLLTHVYYTRQLTLLTWNRQIHTNCTCVRRYDLYVRACFKSEEWTAVYSIHVLGGMICM
jgi:hypothetical protein